MNRTHRQGAKNRQDRQEKLYDKRQNPNVKEPEIISLNSSGQAILALGGELMGTAIARTGAPLLFRYGRRGMSGEAIGALIHPPLQVAIADQEHRN